MRSPRWFLAAAALVACGPAVEYNVPKDPAAGSGSAGSGSATSAAAAGDESVEVAKVDIKGVLLDPLALDTYGVSGAKPPKATTLDAERKVFASQKDIVQKQVHATYLATMLYIESGKQADATARKAMIKEARDVLKEAAGAAGAKVEELTLSLLGSYEMMNDNWADAEAVWTDFVTKFPKDKEIELAKVWVAYSQLKQFKNTEALASVQGISAATVEATYVTAWAKWRTGDNAGAWTAITACAKAWTTPAAIKANAEREGAIRSEVIRFAARTNTSLADSMAFLSGLWGSQAGEQYELLKKVSNAMHFAGRWADAIAADQKALDVAKDKVPPVESVAIPNEQAGFAMRLDDPATVEKYATAAVNAIPACGSACTQADQTAVIEGVANQATILHSIYASANDERYYLPAHDLYQLTLPKIMDEKRRSTIGDYQGRLEASKKFMKVGSGRLGKEIVERTVAGHDQDVQACYEGVLAANPKVAGTIVVTLDIDQSGVVTGATSEPKAGMSELSAVAGCVIDRAKTWKLPARGSKGSTRAKLTYATSKR